MDAARLAHLDAVLLQLASIDRPYSDTVFRILTPRYANRRDALSGDGSRIESGRFHLKGAFLITYAGCTLRQAQWEQSHTARNIGIAPEDGLPLTTLSADVRFSRVLDLADLAVRRRLKVTKTELSGGAWNAPSGESLTQAIGRLAHKHGFEAILTPSRGPGDNLNLLPENLRPGSSVKIVNEDRLPPPG